jgi:uncharacterized protein (TIGR03437 family)
MRRSCLTVALLSALAAQAQQTTAAARLQDLNVVATQVPKLDPNFFVHLDRAKFQQAVDDLQAGVSSLSDAEFYVGLAQLMAMSRDAHTSLILHGDAASAFGFLQYSLAFRWLDDGVFVTAAAAPYSQALGTRLVAVGGVPIDQVVQRLASVISYENDQWLHHMVEQYLAGKQVLEGLHIVPAASSSAMTFQTLAGDQFTLQVAPLLWPPMSAVPSAAQGPVPDYLQSQNLFYWSSYWPSNRLLYFKYNMCANMSPTFASFAASLLQILDANPVAALVLDFRGNGGGNNMVIQPLFDGLKQRLPALFADPDFRVYVAIDKVTASAANDAAMKARLLGDRVLLIGEPTAEPPAMDGNAVEFVLPASRMTGQYSTQFFSPPAGFPDGPLVAPDIPIAVRSTDYFARFDPVMAAILARFSGAPAAPSGNAVTVNGASFRPDQGMAPGSLASAFGTFLPAPDQVLVAGVAAQIVAANASQVNFIVPDAVAPGRVTISVRAAGQELATGEATLTATGPGIFVSLPGDPTQPGAVENQDSSLNSSSNPATKGSVVQIYATGYGPGASLVQVFFADTPAQVTWSGVVGPGLWQINAQVPDSVSGQVSVSIIAGNIASNAVTVWVQ